jgi:hypothetical protein
MRGFNHENTGVGALYEVGENVSPDRHRIPRQLAISRVLGVAADVV